jgi:xyloglucan-specific endo-beta-1,4-glucanase
MLFKLFSFVAVLSHLSVLANAQTISGRFDCLPAGSYTLCQNLWGSGMFMNHVVVVTML